MLSHEEARRVYDRIGAFQDSQAFYEDPATRLVLRHGHFAAATAVFEFGCGTGRFAARLLTDFLPRDATYRATDISLNMVRLAQQRLEPYSPRVSVVLSAGGAPDAEPPDSCDRFVSNYVLDLLPESEIRSVLRSARRMLRPEGLLCLTSLSPGAGPLSRAVSGSWSWLQAHWPTIVGGCRPIDLLRFLPPRHWKIEFHRKVVAFGVTSEVAVAGRQAAD
jgi:ubiquinone/menaquinone biosynthesis C-methylase UbiE